MSSGSIIFVTGGTGYLGAHVVSQLINKGYTVRASARPGKQSSLKRIVPNAGDRLQIVEIADLASGDLTPFLQGVSAVIHIAAPVTVRDNSAEEIVKGTLDGTLNILDAAIKAGVKKLVYTSSAVALFNPDFAKLFQPGIIDETSWGTIGIEGLDPNAKDKEYNYVIAKALAEKKVWELANAHPEVDVTTLLPPTIYGRWAPNVPTPDVSSIGSNQFLYQLITGGSKGPNTYPDWPVKDWVHVVDVAKAHVLALETGPYVLPSGEIGKKRFIITPGQFDWKQAIELLKEKRPELKSRLPSLAEKVQQGVATLDAGPSQRVLGIKKEDQIGWEETVLEVIDLLVANEKP